MDLSAFKWFVKRMFAYAGFQISRLSSETNVEQHLLRIFSSLHVNCVIDVGAYDGSWGRELRHLGYTGYIVSFEPVAENFARLAHASSGDPRWRIFPYGLGDRSGQAEINVFAGTTFHSLLAPSGFGKSAFGEKLRRVRTEMIEIKRLDEVMVTCLEGIPSPRIFLKSDTQGYCLAVLEGAGQALEQVVGLEVEAALSPIYQGMRTTLENMVPELQRRGFGVTGFFPVTRDKRNGLRIIEVDCVAIRSNTTMSDTVRSSAFKPIGLQQ